MTDIHNLPHLYTADDWLDLPIGNKAVIIAKVHHDRYKGDNAITLVFPDWDTLLIEISPPGILDTIHRHDTIHITVTRTEDGLTASLDDVTVQ